MSALSGCADHGYHRTSGHGIPPAAMVHQSCGKPKPWRPRLLGAPHRVTRVGASEGREARRERTVAVGQGGGDLFATVPEAGHARQRS